jgi:hypothetical protein
VPRGLVMRESSQKKIWRPGGRLDGRVRGLETELRSEADPQIVMNAVVEKDIVSDFGAKPDRSGKSFDTSARIDREIRVRAQAYGVHESRGRALVRNAEILEPDLAGHEEPKRSGTGLQLGTEESVEGPEPGGDVGRGDAIVESRRVIAFEVVGHFGFDLGVSRHTDGGPATDSEEVGGVRTWIGEAKVIRKRARLKMVLAMILRHERRSRGQQCNPY